MARQYVKVRGVGGGRMTTRTPAAPVNYTLTINGTTADLKNRYGLPISTDHLSTRRVYHGRYIVPVTGTPYVILLDTPCDIAYALSSAAVAVTTTDGE